MNGGVLRSLGLGSALLAAGCPAAPKEGPPAAETLQIASAAPRALGALAGGTEAAPRAVAAPGAPLRAAPDESSPDEDDEGGGTTPTPDAGAPWPEDVPL